MKRKRRSSQGFSLVEMAIVLVLVALLGSGVAGTLNKTVERTHRVDAQRQLDLIAEALLGFAASWDRLPCPATHTSEGAEDPPGGGICGQQHGFVPAVTLAVPGAVNSDNLLLDPWGNPYRYSVSNPGGWEFTKVNALTLATKGDFVVCTRDSSQSGSCSPATGPDAALTVALNVPATLLSMGSNWANPRSVLEEENAGETMLGSYPIGADRVFVSRSPSELAGREYDDLTMWISTHVLVSKMLTANKLP